LGVRRPHPQDPIPLRKDQAAWSQRRQARRGPVKRQPARRRPRTTAGRPARSGLPNARARRNKKRRTAKRAACRPRPSASENPRQGLAGKNRSGANAAAPAQWGARICTNPRPRGAASAYPGDAPGRTAGFGGTVASRPPSSGNPGKRCRIAARGLPDRRAPAPSAALIARQPSAGRRLRARGGDGALSAADFTTRGACVSRRRPDAGVWPKAGVVAGAKSRAEAGAR